MLLTEGKNTCSASLTHSLSDLLGNHREHHLRPLLLSTP